MKVGIMQPYIFPYIGYYQLIQAVDKFILLDDVSYINRGWINRNRILVNGQEYLFSIPLEKSSQNKLIKNLVIAEVVNWQEKFLKTISYSYKKAPGYSTVFPLIEDIVSNKDKQLSGFIHYSLTKILAYLNVETRIVSSSSVYNNEYLKGKERIMDICQKEYATVYINAIGGKELYKIDDFADKKIKLRFIKSRFSKQTTNGNAALSMIDVLMNHSKEEVKAMLNFYDLE
ncbi:WbqC family protein [Flavisolibacter tropicus]|uniref:WbqC-like protein n=1 Tax=Flavisolibacter tropicus TaxID=1492898 RepID=A0A172TRK2_9BACT|nr:WbqC family protein [Flavisolibacter tropicus]ANE49660.1 hypothetical protein SY85_03225 [Flavisolibacter tropicus]